MSKIQAQIQLLQAKDAEVQVLRDYWAGFPQVSEVHPEIHKEVLALVENLINGKIALIENELFPTEPAKILPFKKPDVPATADEAEAFAIKWRPYVENKIRVNVTNAQGEVYAALIVRLVPPDKLFCNFGGKENFIVPAKDITDYDASPPLKPTA